MGLIVENTKIKLKITKLKLKVGTLGTDIEFCSSFATHSLHEATFCICSTNIRVNEDTGSDRSTPKYCFSLQEDCKCL